METKTITLEKAFYGDYCEWEDEFTVHISPKLQEQIDRMQSLVCEIEFISSVDIHVTDDFMSEQTERLLQEQCPFDVSHITVFATGFVFCLQSKWDAHIQAEYVLV
ncbi:hypothetical protein Enr13x_23700 [Stieleria neptunia]|uniref:Uncharacterized protein n=2 Tax=Stieleria neptunia TaxID=2527979 RepID=A0A518HNV4_9BACT|nr:hypothetical protein Enr13x_23700 [Stieleria neptunia]